MCDHFSHISNTVTNTKDEIILECAEFIYLQKIQSSKNNNSSFLGIYIFTNM